MGPKVESFMKVLHESLIYTCWRIIALGNSLAPPHREKRKPKVSFGIEVCRCFKEIRTLRGHADAQLENNIRGNLESTGDC